MEINDIKSTIEAILFASGEPVSVGKLAEVLAIDRATVRRIAELLIDEYDDRGLSVVWLEDSLQICTKSKYADVIRAVLEQKRNMPLSQAALEALAVIAYNQPVTKGYIEQVRGVDSSGVTNSLLEKGLIEERGRMDVPGKPILYGTSLLFLKCFELSSLKELPKIDDRNIEDEEEVLEAN